MRRTLLRFLLIGGFAAAVNIASRIALNFVFPFGVSIVIAFFVGVTLAFVLNRKFVFPGRRDPSSVQYLRFLVVNLLALAQVYVVTYLALYGLRWWPIAQSYAETIAHSVGVLSPVATSFILHKSFTFRADQSRL